MVMQILKIPMTNGINLLSDNRKIDDKEIVSGQNLVPVQPGVISLRSGTMAALPCNDLCPRQLFLPPRDIITTGGFLPGAVIEFVTIEEATPPAPGNATFYIHARDNNGSLLFSVPGQNDVSMLWKAPILFYSNNIYVWAPVSAPLVVGGPSIPATGVNLTSPGGPTAFQFQGTNNQSVPSPKAATVYQNRVFYANFGPGHENLLTAADQGDPTLTGADILSPTGWNIPINTNDSDEIIALKEVMLTSVGSPTQSALLILKQRSVFLLTGQPNQTTDHLPFVTVSSGVELKKVAFNCGCSAPDSIVTTPYGTIWANNENVWLFRDGAAPIPIGKKIRPALQQSTAQQQWMWHAAYYNGFYRLAVYQPDPVKIDYPFQTMPDTPACGEQYWLDLRNGTPENENLAQWWGPITYNLGYPGWLDDGVNTPAQSSATNCPGTFSMAQETRMSRVSVLYGVGNSGWLNELDIVDQSRDLPSGISYPGITPPTFGSSPQVLGSTYFVPISNYFGSELISNALTKNYDLADPAIQKIFDTVEANITFWNTQAISNRWYLDQQIQDNQTFVIPKLGIGDFILDLDELDINSGLNRKTQSIAIHSDSAKRNIAFNGQMRLNFETGYTLAPSETAFLFKSLGVMYIATLPGGANLSIHDLIDQVRNSVGIAIGFPMLTTSLNPPSVPTTVITSSQNWAPILSGAEFPGELPLQVLSTRNIWALMGFVAGIAPISEATTFTAPNQAFPSVSPQFEVGGADILFSVIPRRPQ